jgi:dTDP-glucose 4,6-dehydratase/UDP-glucose 4-epimerase
VKIVFASTRQLYGKPEYLPVDERHPVRPVDVNGINKLAGEWYHLLYNNVYGIRACALRLTNTYGPGMRVKDARQSFLGLWVRLLVEGRNVEVFGDGTQRRDFNFVDDCVDALLAAGSSETANGKVYNLGSAEVVSLAELARLMVELAGEGTLRARRLSPPIAGRSTSEDYCGDYSLIRGELGWEPRVGLREGLAKTLDYYRRHGAAYWDRDA